MPLSRFKMTAIACITLITAWLVATTTIGSVFARQQPDIALAWSSGNAEARGNRALRLFNEQPASPPWSRITRDARAALGRSAANVPAVAMLAAHADATGRARLANRLFVQSNRMSRHERITQLYLIEASVARSDIPAALKHYDAALSTSRSSIPLLMPVLVTASAGADIAKPLARLLERRPVWWEDFTRRIVQTREDPGPSFPILLRALRLDATKPAEQVMLSAAINRLLDAGHGTMAYGFYRRTKPNAPARPLSLRDGGFEESSRLPPIDWDMRDGAGSEGASGSIQPLGQGHALFVSVETGRDSEVARQRLLLAPGSYLLSAMIGSEDGPAGDTAVSVTCPGRSAPIAILRAPAPAGRATFRASFVVPSGCSHQQMSVLASPAEQLERQSWVDDVAIAPMPR
jgi:hypothetical protein